jgi:hypothetical protein
MDNYNNSKTVSQLKFIASIPEGKKIDTYGLTLHNDSWYTSIMRTVSLLNHDSKERSRDFIFKVFSRSIEILNSSIQGKKPSEREFCRSLLKDIYGAQVGVINLTKTYKSDVRFACDIITMLEHLNFRLADIEEYNPEIFKGIIPTININLLNVHDLCQGLFLWEDDKNTQI